MISSVSSSTCSVVIAMALSTTPVAAQQTSSSAARPEILTRLVACRSLAAEARLACYDAAAGALDSAERQGDVVVVDRAQAEAVRRGLFGFEMPALPDLFSRDGGRADLNTIETRLTRATMGGDGQWTFRLEDGSVWRQTDGTSVGFRNRPGQSVRVRRAALGSFLLTIDNSRGVRVRRQ